MRITLLSFVVLAVAATEAAAQFTPPPRPRVRPYLGDKAPLVQVGASLGVFRLPQPTLRPTCEEYHVPCAEPGAEPESDGFGGAFFAMGRITPGFGVMAQLTAYGTSAAETKIVTAGPMWTTVSQDPDGKTASGMPFVSVLVGRGAAGFGASGPVLQVAAGMDVFQSTTGPYPELAYGVDVGCRIGAGGARHFTGCALTLRASMGFGLR